jgi:hypothetical protein
MRKAPVGAWRTVELRGGGRLFGFFTFKNERTGFYCAKASQYGHRTRRQGNPMLLPSFPPFIRSAGITQIFVLGVISCHFAPRTSFDLVAVRMQNSKVRAAIDSDLRSCVMNAGIVAILSMERKPEIVKSIPSFPYILKSL